VQSKPRDLDRGPFFYLVFCGAQTEPGVNECHVLPSPIAQVPPRTARALRLDRRPDRLARTRRRKGRSRKSLPGNAVATLELAYAT
jgi:hypothetical protein